MPDVTTPNGYDTELGKASLRHGHEDESPEGEAGRRLWRPNRGGGRFYAVQLPTSSAAERLLSRHPDEGKFAQRWEFYAEFDTDLEAEAWKEYLYDPLKVLVAERIRLPYVIEKVNGNYVAELGGHIGIKVLKLEELRDANDKQVNAYADEDEQYEIAKRGEASHILLKQVYEPDKVGEGTASAAIDRLKKKFPERSTADIKREVDTVQNNMVDLVTRGTKNENGSDHGWNEGVVFDLGDGEKLEDILKTAREKIRVSTIVLNHEVALNPRIGMT